MAAERVTGAAPEPMSDLALVPVATLPRTRALAWSNDTLYISRGYTVEQGSFIGSKIDWHLVGRYDAPTWRRLSNKVRLTHRLFRDGFHALTALPSRHLIGVVPGAIVMLAPGAAEFVRTHTITRGTRPLHITATPDGTVLWGEYFDNRDRGEVHIYASGDCGATWHVAYTFPRRAVRHIHNIVHDPWGKCLWILTGDEGSECQILRASCDLTSVDVVLVGNQQARAVAFVPTPEGLYFASDTPLEANYVYRLDRNGRLHRLSSLSSSCIYGCRVRDHVFFSTMVEPSQTNLDQQVRLYGGNGDCWKSLLAWKKDRWPMRFFQYGNAVLPDGANSTDLLAVSIVAVKGADLTTTIFRIT